MLDLNPGTGISNPFLSSGEAANFQSLSSGRGLRMMSRRQDLMRNWSTVARTVFPLRGVAGRDPTLALTAMMLHGQDGWRRGERRAVWHRWGCIRGLKTDQKRQRADEAE